MQYFTRSNAMLLSEVQVAYASQLTTTLTFAFTKLAVLLFYKR